MASVQVMAAAVPTATRATYLEYARKSADLFRKHGALAVAENWGQDVPDGELTSFPLAVKCQPDETVVVSWIIWPDRAAQDKGWEALMPEMQAMGGMPFDGKRMIFGTFESMLDA